MKSIKSVYKIGSGPSSSHTMGPENAVLLFLKEVQPLTSYKAILYGSLSLTGKGHLTDWIIEKTFKDHDISGEVIFDNNFNDLGHPNQMELIGYDADNQEKARWVIYSIGGGEIIIEGRDSEVFEEDIYEESTFQDIKIAMGARNLTLLEYINQNDTELDEYLVKVWKTMDETIERGVRATGVIPGKIKLPRRANTLFLNMGHDQDKIISAYAYAVNEENACGNTIVTAPTCGACGVLPAVLKYFKEFRGCTDEHIYNALKIAGLFGNLVRTNGSISGAEAGCQAEVGTATAMASAAITYLKNNDATALEIESAAEIGLEHQLGLTCDPILGYVQIPCIQRNAVGAIKAVLASKLAEHMDTTKIINFDTIVYVMLETGKDMASGYRETSEAGLAKVYLELNKGK